VFPIAETGSLVERETWTPLQNTMIDAMVKFDGVFRPRLAKLKI